VARDAYDVMNLKALRCFWAMAKYGSLVRAGVELGIAEPAVSQRIRSLEQYLGVKLYEARGGRVRLTTAGERTYELAIGLFRDLENFEQHVVRDGATGSLTVAAPENVLRYLLPEIVQGFAAQCPLVRLRLMNRSVADIMRGVRVNEFDLGITSARKPPQDLVFRIVRTYKSYLLLRRGHPLTRTGIPAFGQLLKEDILLRYPLVVAERDDPDDHRLQETLERLGLPYNPGMEVGTQETLKYYVSRGLGVAVVSGICISDLDRAVFDVIEIPSELGGDTPYGVVTRRDKRLSGPIQQLFQLLGVEVPVPPAKAAAPKAARRKR